MSKKQDGKEFIPEVVIPDHIKEDMAKDPELAKALMGFIVSAKNAMQAVEDGRYKSFEDAIEDMTGSRPERVNPDTLSKKAKEDIQRSEAEFGFLIDEDDDE